MATIPELVAELRAALDGGRKMPLRMSMDEIRLLLDWNDELVTALKAADDLHRMGLLAAPVEFIDKVWNLRRSALARLTEAKD